MRMDAARRRAATSRLIQTRLFQPIFSFTGFNFDKSSFIDHHDSSSEDDGISGTSLMSELSASSITIGDAGAVDADAVVGGTESPGLRITIFA